MFEKLNEIESTSGSKDKLKLLEEWVAENTYDAATMLGYALSPYEIFGVSTKSVVKAMGVPYRGYKDIGDYMENADISQESIFGGHSTRQYYSGTIQGFIAFIEKIKKLSGNEMIEELKKFFSDCSPQQAKWYARILCKDLKCGVSLSTANKALKANKMPLIDTFEVGLCGVLPNKKQELFDALEDKYAYYIYTEPKYDGIRLIVTNKTPDRKFKAFTRNGKVRDNVEFLTKEFDNNIDSGIDVTLDGELMSGKDFFDVTKKKKGAAGRFYQMFDILDYGEDLREKPYEERRGILLENFPVNSKTLRITDARKRASKEDVWQDFVQAVEEGYEGLIVKTNAAYKDTYKRKAWFKIKPLKEMTLRVVEQHFGTGKYKDKRSVITVSDKSGKLISKVGTGFNDTTIDYMTDNDIIGQFVEVAFDCLTPVNDDGKQSLRFPRFIKWREDISEEDSI